MRTIILGFCLLVSDACTLRASDAPEEKILLTAKYSDVEVVTLSEREFTAQEIKEYNSKWPHNSPSTGGRFTFWKKVNVRTKESVLLYTKGITSNATPIRSDTFYDMQIINDNVITLVQIVSCPEAVVVPLNGKAASQHVLRLETEFSGAVTGPTRGVRTIGGKIVDFKSPILTVDLESWNNKAKKHVDRIEIDITKKLEASK